MFKKGQLLLNRRRRFYVEVVAWPLVRRIVRNGVEDDSIRDGFMYHANANGHTLIGNNYKAKG